VLSAPISTRAACVSRATGEILDQRRAQYDSVSIGDDQIGDLGGVIPQRHLTISQQRRSSLSRQLRQSATLLRLLLNAADQLLNLSFGALRPKRRAGHRWRAPGGS
jgi:hypothetical protein